MPATGQHRPRKSSAQRARGALSWPNPAGVLISVAGATLVFSGATSLHGGFDLAGTTPSQTSAAASPTVTSPTFSPSTPSPTAIPAATAAGLPTTQGRPATVSHPSPSAPSSAPASALSDTATTLAPAGAATVVVAGAASSSPIQKLYAAGIEGHIGGVLLNLANPASPLVVVNKQRPLSPLDYMPADLVSPHVATGSGEPARLRKEAATAVERMFAAASGDGVALSIMSSFRSYSTQVALYGSYVAQKGVPQADTSSARPGFSEHQTGLALDIGDPVAGPACEFTYCMADSAAGKWVAAHGAGYGFVVRYQLGMEGITGYLAEPWHLRYVGVAVARDMTLRGVKSYEQYLGIPGAATYK